MAAPRTWVTGELVTASIMNLDVRDAMNSLVQAKGLVFGIGDFNGIPLTTGVKGYFSVPFGIRVTGWTLLADAVGNLVIDIWRDSFANFPPTVADTITGSEKPTLTGAQKAQNLTLTSWTGDLQANDVLAANVESTSGVIKSASLTLKGSLLALV